MTKRVRAQFIASIAAVFLAAFAVKPFLAGVAHANITATNSGRIGIRSTVTNRLPLDIRFEPRQQKSGVLPPTNSVTSATALAAEPLIAVSALQHSAALEKPTIVASAKAAAAPVVRNSGAPIIVPRDRPGPVRFFTINQVLAKQHQAKPDAVHLAAINPKTVTDATPPAAPPAEMSTEPFGLFTFRAPDGQLWIKWHKLEADIKAEAPTLARCRAEKTQCTLATYRFVAIIKAAAAKQGQARLEEVNRRVNAAIRYTSDIGQWGVPDLWSAPLDVDGKGSFDTGKGDCEDYAIAKYVALREAGMPEKDLRILLVRDKVVNMGHAVLAARDDGRWLVMDNRFDRMLAESEADFLLPLFVVDTDGVKLFAVPYAANRDASSKSLVAGAGVSPADSPVDVDAAWGK